MTKTEALQSLFTTQNVELSVPGVVINLLLTAILAYILAKVYVRFGTSLSNRKAFAANFLIIATTTMFIITIVKSSLALSLGLVGALSIVRFRSAIKEPEELAYLFLTIAVGLGFGADQRLITPVIFALIIGTICVRGWRRTSKSESNLYLTVWSDQPSREELEQIVSTLQETCNVADLRRLEEGPDSLEASFYIEFSDFAALQATKERLRSLGESTRVSFVDHRGML